MLPPATRKLVWERTGCLDGRNAVDGTSGRTVFVTVRTRTIVLVFVLVLTTVRTIVLGGVLCWTGAVVVVLGGSLGVVVVAGLFAVVLVEAGVVAVVLVFAGAVEVDVPAALLVCPPLLTRFWPEPPLIT